MALRSKNESIEVPGNAILLTEKQALTYYLKLIRGWEKTSDVWPMIFGPGILGALSAATGVYINNHFRTKLKLGQFGKVSSYLPIVVLPAIMSTLFHETLIQPSVILRKDQCPLCLQLRAATIQAGFGVVYPFILSPLASLMFATRHFTYRIPSITEQPMEVLKLLKKLSQSKVGAVTTFLFVNAFVGMLVTYKEMDSFYRFNITLQELEAKEEFDR